MMNEKAAKTDSKGTIRECSLRCMRRSETHQNGAELEYSAAQVAGLR
jgi:hypothetical protein